LLDPWKLEIRDGTIMAQAPRLRASVPPAFDTSRMKSSSSRGWLRFSADDLLQQLHRDLTPALNRLAEDPRRLNLVRENCRQSVMEFISLWLEGQSEIVCQRIEIRFPDDPSVTHPHPPRLLKQAPWTLN
jgi:hypothetical protein